jgi:hypothetical protein
VQCQPQKSLKKKRLREPGVLVLFWLIHLAIDKNFLPAYARVPTYASTVVPKVFQGWRLLKAASLPCLAEYSKAN